MGVPVLKWELVAAEEKDVVDERTFEGEYSIVEEISRARVHQGWLVRCRLYRGETLHSSSVTFVRDENYQWDEKSHLE